MRRWPPLDEDHARLLIDELTPRPPRIVSPGRPTVGELRDRHELSEGPVGRSSSRTLAMKSPSIEVSALVASAIITLLSGEWWHWVAVIAAIVVVRVLRK
jgi:hypothetical protein